MAIALNPHISATRPHAKVAVMGGGSTYTPELVNGFLERVDRFPLDELWLLDINPERLAVVGAFAQRMAEAKGSRFSVHLTTDRRKAIRDADYVTTQLRVGQMAARHADEYLGRRHGLIGQETTGVGGMAKALRTIPVILDIARDVQELAKPGALLVNFTNPAGLVTQALSQYAAVPSVGVCNAPINAQRDFAKRLSDKLGQAIDPARTELKTLGLNHLTWHGFTLDGEDVWPTVLESVVEDLRASEHPAGRAHDRSAEDGAQLLPAVLLLHRRKTKRPGRLAAVARRSGGRSEESLLKQYADPALSEPPADLMKRGGAYYSTVATQLLNAHYNDLGETHVVNVANQGAVKEWPAEWVLELPATVRHSGITPQSMPALPPACFGLIAQIKASELLTVQAAVHGDRDAAYQALLTHPLGPSADRVGAVLDDLLETHRAHLPRFWA